MAWWPGRVGQGLNGDDLDDQVVGAQPGLRVIEQVSDDVPDGGTGEALPGEPDGCAGDVEAGGVEAEGGDVFGVGAEAAANHHRALPGS